MSGTEFQTGEWGLEGLDLNYFAARYYDPILGRWHAPDPLEQCHSPYLAMLGDPANFIDPDGRAGIPFLQDFMKSDGGTFLLNLAGQAAFLGAMLSPLGSIGGTISNIVSVGASLYSVGSGVKNLAEFTSEGSTKTYARYDFSAEYSMMKSSRHAGMAFDTGQESSSDPWHEENGMTVSDEGDTLSPDDWIRNKKTSQLEYRINVTNKWNTPEGYDYIGDSKDALQASLEQVSKQKSFDDGNIISHTSSIFSLAGEYGSTRYNISYSSLFRSRFTEISYRGIGFLDNTGKIWRNAASSTFVRSSIVKKMPPITRFNTTWGKIGAVGSAFDIGISFLNASRADNPSGIFYYSLEGYLKMPSFIPGFIGLSYGIAFDNVMRPTWHFGYGTYNNSIDQGTNPSVIFIMPGLGYCPRIY
jgi:RHS repeat-associated protein